MKKPSEEFYRVYANEYYNNTFSKVMFCIIICTLLFIAPLASFITLNNVHVYIDTRIDKCMFIIENTRNGSVKKPCPEQMPESYQAVLISDKNEFAKRQLLYSRGFDMRPMSKGEKEIKSKNK